MDRRTFCLSLPLLAAPAAAAPPSPEDVRIATELLSRCGLPDVRGLAWRRVTVAGESPGAAPVATAGWLLPGRPARVVLTSGAVRTPLSVGPTVGLHREVREALRRERPMPSLRSTRTESLGFVPASRWWHFSGRDGVHLVHPLALCLLHRAGEANLVAQLWERLPRTDDFVQETMRFWTEIQLSEGLAAYLRGDDAAALESVGRVLGEQTALEPLLYQREGDIPALRLAKMLHDAAEQHRGRPKPDDDALAALPQDRRIAACIEALEHVTLTESMQSYGKGPVWLLLASGDDAVEALLACAATDTRWSRISSPQYGAPALTRAIDSVRHLAENLAWEILQAPRTAPGDALTVARRLRGVPVEERWLRTLADDHANPFDWLTAADSIADKGGTLRRRSGPSVTDLLRRRIATCRTADPERAVGLALALARWEPAASLSILKDLAADARAQFDGRAGGRPSYQAVTALVSVTVARLVLGGGAEEYARGLLQTPMECFVGPNTDPSAVFEPLRRFPNHPTLVDCARLLCDRPGPLIPASLFRTEDLVVPAFRRYLLAHLDDPLPVGMAPPSRLPVEGALLYGDLCVYYLAWSQGFAALGLPALGLARTVSQRRRTRGALRRYIERWGRFAVAAPTTTEYLAGPWRSRMGSTLQLPERLDPATVRDVAEGAAVFTLEGRGDARLAELPIALPIPASPVGGVYPTGYVVQAEEVRENGIWKRYYGFVGLDRIERVPADAVTLYEPTPAPVDRSLAIGLTTYGSSYRRLTALTSARRSATSGS